MMAWIYKAWLWCKSNRVVQGVNVSITDAPGGGKLIDVNLPGGLIAGLSPWEIVAAGGESVKVSTNSSLMTRDDTAAGIGAIGDSFTLTAGQVLFLHLVFGGGVTVTLEAGDKWANYPRVYNTTGSGTLLDPFVLSDAYFLIGYRATLAEAEGLEGVTIRPATGDAYKIVRTCYTPLILDFRNPGSGFVFEFPRPHIRPGPDV